MSDQDSAETGAETRAHPQPPMPRVALVGRPNGQVHAAQPSASRVAIVEPTAG